MKKIKEHRFVIDVRTRGTRKQAENDLLYCFASRKPDGSMFFLKSKAPKR